MEDDEMKKPGTIDAIPGWIFEGGKISSSDLRALRDWVIALKLEREEAADIFRREREGLEYFAEDVHRFFRRIDRMKAPASERSMRSLVKEALELEDYAAGVLKMLREPPQPWPDSELRKSGGPKKAKK